MSLKTRVAVPPIKVLRYVFLQVQFTFVKLAPLTSAGKSWVFGRCPVRWFMYDLRFRSKLLRFKMVCLLI